MPSIRVCAGSTVSAELLAVRDLQVSFRTESGVPAPALRGVSFEVPENTTVALVGESGSGKSVSAMAVLGLLPGNARVSGEIRFEGQSLIGAPPARLRALRADGPVALWGAGAKGCTLAALVDPDATLVDSLVDINPGKQGHFVAGTGHPILAPAQAAARGVRSAILMNPNYLDECREMLQRDRVDIQLLELD